MEHFHSAFDYGTCVSTRSRWCCRLVYVPIKRLVPVAADLFSVGHLTMTHRCLAGAPSQCMCSKLVLYHKSNDHKISNVLTSFLRSTPSKTSPSICRGRSSDRRGGNAHLLVERSSGTGCRTRCTQCPLFAFGRVQGRDSRARS